MSCPKCGYPQYCPCKICKDRLPKDKKPWIWIDGNFIKCAGCGLTHHCDWWEEQEYKKYKESNDRTTS